MQSYIWSKLKLETKIPNKDQTNRAQHHERINSRSTIVLHTLYNQTNDTNALQRSASSNDRLLPATSIFGLAPGIACVNANGFVVSLSSSFMQRNDHSNCRIKNNFSVNKLLKQFKFVW